MASTGITVSPELLRTTAQKIDTDLEHAIAVVTQYVQNHQDVVQASQFTGDAAGASLTTAGQLSESLNKTITGCQRLAHGLRKAATLMETHEADSAHSFHGLFGDPGQAV